VPKSVAKIIFVAVPAGERVPPLILREVTRSRRRRSAALLVGGTAGSSTKTNNAATCVVMRAQDPLRGVGHAQERRAQAPQCRLQRLPLLAAAGRVGMGERRGALVQGVDAVRPAAHRRILPVLTDQFIYVA
jgi:hypothetical protein